VYASSAFFIHPNKFLNTPKKLSRQPREFAGFSGSGFVSSGLAFSYFISLILNCETRLAFEEALVELLKF
jgi:hypothetical protein